MNPFRMNPFFLGIFLTILAIGLWSVFPKIFIGVVWSNWWFGFFSGIASGVFGVLFFIIYVMNRR